MIKKLACILLLLFIFVGNSHAIIVGYSRGGTAPSPYLFSWACENLTAEVFNVTDGGTITPDSDGVPSYSFVSGQTNNAIQLDSATWASVPATDGNNINLSAGTVKFDYRLQAGTSSSAHRIIVLGTSANEFDLKRSSIGENRYSFSLSGSTYYMNTLENLYDGSWHSVELIWNCASQTASLVIDSSTYPISLGSTDTPFNSNGLMYFNGFNSTSSALTSQYDNVTVE